MMYKTPCTSSVKWEHSPPFYVKSILLSAPLNSIINTSIINSSSYNLLLIHYIYLFNAVKEIAIFPDLEEFTT